MPSIERYVPPESNSLSSDAPGWNSASHISTNTQKPEPTGPTCWKCKGQGKVMNKTSAREQKRKENHTKKPKINGSEADFPMKGCPVCNGRGFISPKKKEMLSLSCQPGMITRKRKCPHGWKCSGPTAHAVEEMQRMFNEKKNSGDIESMPEHPLFFLCKANTMEVDDAGVSVPSTEDQNYPWFPSNKGEQLCNLVGSWRILQRVGSHRWTTDDIVTAYIAIQQKIKGSCESKQPLRYLDLGCGNGSVLQMVSWGLLNKFDLKAYGIEARSEAVGLARRSLSFNTGKDNIGKRVSVIHGDIRDLERDVPFDNGKGNNDPEQLKDFYLTKGKKFDLVTGTPPYFRVDFSTEKEKPSLGTAKGGKVVTSAVINQGGMPTSIQSAPARCEFRGGIEAYCRAAASVLSDDGVFIVCENWLNNERVYGGAESAGFKVLKVYPVKGKKGRKENLFGVYVLQKKSMNSNVKEGKEGNDSVVVEPLSVRTECGKWTLDYADLLESMAIPAKHNAM